MLTLQNENNLRCCDRCSHSADRPCPKFIDCITEGPLCHEDAKCKQMRLERLSKIRGEKLERPVIYVGAATCGLAAGADQVLTTIKSYLSEKKVEADVVEVGCIGFCAVEPIVDVQLPGKTRVSYQQVTPELLPTILDTALSGKVAEEHVLGQFTSQVVEGYPNAPSIFDHPFCETKAVGFGELRCDRSDSINEYIARGGIGVSIVIRDNTPAEVCDNVEKSGLRGRGGGGFPTGKKWKFALEAVGKQKYIVCNATKAIQRVI